MNQNGSQTATCAMIVLPSCYFAPRRAFNLELDVNVIARQQAAALSGSPCQRKPKSCRRTLTWPLNTSLETCDRTTTAGVRSTST